MRNCRYKNLFGKPNEGAHKHRILGVAFVDLTLTILLSVIIAYFIGKNPLIVFSVVFVIGEILHYIFCVPTAVLKFLHLAK